MEIEIKQDERIDSLEYKELQIIQKKDGFCFGMDSIILSNFVRIPGKNAIIADLGTGTGIISILIAAKNKINKIYGFEIQEEMAEMADRSMIMNNLQEKVEIKNEDICGMSKRNWNKKFDVVITNPPYKKINTGLTNENKQKLISRHEVKCTLENIIYESAKILKDKGIFYMVHRPDRVVDILKLMRENKLEPKEIRLVYPHITDEANLVLIKGVKCGKEYLRILKPLIVYKKDNTYSEEILKIYEKEEEK